MAAAQLTAVATALLHSSLSCPVGAQRAQARSNGWSETENALLVWQRYEHWLHQQLDDWRTYLRTGCFAATTVATLVDQPSGDDVDVVEERIDTLKEDLLYRSADLARTRDFLQRLEQQSVYAQLAFADLSSSPAQRRGLSLVAAAYTSRGALLLRYRDQLVVEAVQVHSRLYETREKLEALRQENLRAHADNRTMAASLSALETKRAEERRAAQAASHRADPSSAKRAAELGAARDVNRITRHVLQNLIVESGVDWFEDTALRELMLRLEGGSLLEPSSG